MQSATSKVHWVGAECNDHALISCTVGGDLLMYRKGQVVGGRPGELKLKKIDPKQLPRIQSRLSVITSPIAQETRRSYTAGECSAEQAMVQMIAVRVTTARQLMHSNLEGRSNRQDRGPHRSREQARNLEGSGDIKSGTDICEKTWTSISSSHAMSSRIWNLPCPPNDAAGGTSRHPLPTVEDCAERNDRAPPERSAFQSH